MQTTCEWRELYRSVDHQMARNLATCIEAMEFRARVVTSGGFDPATFPHDDSTPLLVQVTTADWPALFDVLDELVAEQLEFDAFIESWDERTRRNERRLLIVLIIVVGALAAIGATDL